ncbi:MAG: glycosyltransferase family 2 protein [Butyrivibrio sp.]|nr:glycosyltransferase family 2 protein [Butyrivibrio sp.]
MAVEDILRYAFEKFDNNEYDDAILAFMAAHQACDDLQGKEEIFRVVNENFIAPNEEEFRKSYRDNCVFLEKKKRIHFDEIPNYEDLPLKMIPVSDSKFYVWNNEAKRFEGKDPVIISDLDAGEKKEKEFSPLLIDGYANIRLVLSEYREIRYQRLYLVYRDRELIREFFSFFAIPGIGKMLEDICVDIFDDENKLREYFIESSAYIPRHIKTKTQFDYATIFSEIHISRINGKRKGDNVYLSICIPTWNRGKDALEALSTLQKLMYDEEVEFVICNNESTKELEYYRQIAEIARKDKRIVYREMKSKCYRDSFENVVGIPAGRYAVFSTDQDYLITDFLDIALNYIYNHEKVGVITFKAKSQDGTVYYEREESIIYEGDFQKIFHASGSNYLSGLCFNMDMVRQKKMKKKLYDKYHDNEENLFYLNYTHCVYATYLAAYSVIAFSNIMLFNEARTDENYILDNGELKYQYVYPENRVKNFNSELEVLLDIGMEPLDLAQCILNIFCDVYRLLRIAYGYYMDKMLEKHSWREACTILYDAQREILKNERLLDQIGRDYYPQKMEYHIAKWYIEEISKEPISLT